VQVNSKAILKANEQNRSVDPSSLVSKNSTQTVLHTFTSTSEVSLEHLPPHKQNKPCFLKKASFPPKTVEVTIQPQDPNKKTHLPSQEDARNPAKNKKTIKDKSKKPAAVCKTGRTKEKKQKDQQKLQEMKTSQIGTKKRKPLLHLAVTMIQDGPEVSLSHNLQTTKHLQAKRQSGACLPKLLEGSKHPQTARHHHSITLPPEAPLPSRKAHCFSSIASLQQPYRL